MSNSSDLVRHAIGRWGRRDALGARTMQILGSRHPIDVERGDDERGFSDVDIQAQIDSYIAAQPQPKRDDLQTLHRAVLNASPSCRLWFFDGRNEEGKVVSNPSIGYGVQARQYADGETREFYQVGLSANTTGISVYVIGLDDKKYLSETYGQSLGKAKITGYCVKFRNLRDVNLRVVEQMIANHLGKRAAL